MSYLQHKLVGRRGVAVKTSALGGCLAPVRSESEIGPPSSLSEAASGALRSNVNGSAAPERPEPRDKEQPLA